MERKVPSTASEEIELYLRTIYSLLRSTTEVQIRTLEEVHAATSSLLHPHARDTMPDISAFIYTLLRLPSIMPSVRTVILGQSASVFAKRGYAVETWKEVPARARRRRCLFDGRDTLACIIASRSDIEDVIPALTAFQIEWNKLHILLQKSPAGFLDMDNLSDNRWFSKLSRLLGIPVDDLGRLETVCAGQFGAMLKEIASGELNLRVLLLDSSLSEYWRATRGWLDNIATAYPGLPDKPVYFVSSNPHSIPNLLTGFALNKKEELIQSLHDTKDADLIEEYEAIKKSGVSSSESNFLYYILKKYQQSEQGEPLNYVTRVFVRNG